MIFKLISSLFVIHLMVFTAVQAENPVKQLYTKKGGNAVFDWDPKPGNVTKIDVVNFGIIHNGSYTPTCFTVPRTKGRETQPYDDGVCTSMIKRFVIPDRKDLESGVSKVVLQDVTSKDSGMYYMQCRLVGKFTPQPRQEYNLTVIPKPVTTTPPPPPVTAKPINKPVTTTPPSPPVTAKPINGQAATKLANPILVAICCALTFEFITRFIV